MCYTIWYELYKKECSEYTFERKEDKRMEFMSLIIDNRINSKNLLVKTTFGEYLSFANKIINNNDLQRKRVKASKTIYSLLKSDLKKAA